MRDTALSTYSIFHGGAFRGTNELTKGVPTDMTANVPPEQDFFALKARNGLFLGFFVRMSSTGRVSATLKGLIGKKLEWCRLEYRYI